MRSFEKLLQIIKLFHMFEILHVDFLAEGQRSCYLLRLAFFSFVLFENLFQYTSCPIILTLYYLISLPSSEFNMTK